MVARATVLALAPWALRHKNETITFVVIDKAIGAEIFTFGLIETGNMCVWPLILSNILFY
jgi:hypothetical protein